MKKVLKEVCEVSEIRPLSRTVMSHLYSVFIFNGVEEPLPQLAVVQFTRQANHNMNSMKHLTLLTATEKH
jgi:hypothetical protein